MIKSHAKAGSPEIILEDSDIALLKQSTLDGLPLPVIAQMLGISRATLCKIIDNNSEVSIAYGNARSEYLAPYLKWHKSLFDKKIQLNEEEIYLISKGLPLKKNKRIKMRNNPLEDNLKTKCLAKTRRGTLCQKSLAKGKNRCRMHGGAEGSGAKIGNKNAFKHGRYSSEAILTRLRLRIFIRIFKTVWTKGCDDFDL